MHGFWEQGDFGVRDLVIPIFPRTAENTFVFNSRRLTEMLVAQHAKQSDHG